MNLISATTNSVNAVYAQLDVDVGPQNVRRDGALAGDHEPARRLSRPRAIGGLRIGVSPLEMADAYATFADGGIHHDATAIDEGRVPATAGRRAVDQPRGRARDLRRHRLRGDRRSSRPCSRPAPGRPASRLPARPARPGPPTNRPMPGSSATRRRSRPRSGSAIRIRAVDGSVRLRRQLRGPGLAGVHGQRHRQLLRRLPRAREPVRGHRLLQRHTASSSSGEPDIGTSTSPSQTTTTARHTALATEAGRLRLRSLRARRRPGAAADSAGNGGSQGGGGGAGGADSGGRG